MLKKLKEYRELRKRDSDIRNLQRAIWKIKQLTFDIDRGWHYTDHLSKDMAMKVNESASIEFDKFKESQCKILQSMIEELENKPL